MKTRTAFLLSSISISILLWGKLQFEPKSSLEISYQDPSRSSVLCKKSKTESLPLQSQRHRNLGQPHSASEQSENLKRVTLQTTQQLYTPLLNALHLAASEEKYFIGLLAEEFLLWHEIATSTDRSDTQVLAKGLQEWNQKQEKKIAYFLNHDEDMLLFKNFHERLPEYQFMDDIRAGIEASGNPLSTEQEENLVELMYRFRKKSLRESIPDIAEDIYSSQTTNRNQTQNSLWPFQEEYLKEAALGFLDEKQVSILIEISKRS